MENLSRNQIVLQDILYSISVIYYRTKRNRNTFSVLRLLYQLKFHIVFYSFQADGKAYRKHSKLYPADLFIQVKQSEAP